MVALVLPDGVSLDELIAHCRTRLPYFAVPRYAEVVDALPRTPTNRVRKAELRARGIGPATVDFGRPRRAASAPVAAGG
jgi:crotonobetaine/carnitine-CoA ligase